MRVSHNEGGREKRHEVNLLTSTLIRCLTGPVLLERKSAGAKYRLTKGPG